jgi:hypothetical protein
MSLAEAHHDAKAKARAPHIVAREGGAGAASREANEGGTSAREGEGCSSGEDGREEWRTIG